MIGVVVRCREHWLVDDRVYGQLFAQLASEARFERFLRFALSARELPEPGEVCACWPPRHQKTTLALHDGRGHDDDRHRGRSAADW